MQRPKRDAPPEGRDGGSIAPSRHRVYRIALSAVVPATLGTIAVFTAVSAEKDVAQALSHPGMRSWLVAGYGCLRTIVTLAFTAFTVNRDAPVRRAGDPVAYLACVAAVVTITMLRPPAASIPTGFVLAGDLVALVFYGWVLGSVLTLRRCFGVLPEARGLVTSGPYGFVRHPVYLGELGACVGLVIAAPSILNLALFAALALAQWVRMGFEERALGAAFPEYLDYADRTPRLCPSFRSPRRAKGARDSLVRSWS